MSLMLMIMLYREELWIENTTYKDKHVVDVDDDENTTF